ncbi:MAG: hypothetical protein Kow0089_00930 [Desulfobulbaceae bacterium]
MSSDTSSLSSGEHNDKLRMAEAENRLLIERNRELTAYIREKTNQLLTVIGTVPLDPGELDDATLIQLDPIGIVSDSFVQVLQHLRETNQDLERARNDIRAIFDSVGEGIQVLNREGEIIAYNRKMTDLFVLDEKEVIGKTCREAVCADETDAKNCLFNMVRDREKSVRARSWKCRDRYYEIIGTPVFDDQGTLQRVVILYLDITRRRKSELALKESEDRFRDLFENASDMLQSTDPAGRILVVNKAWRETLGYGEDEPIGMNIFDIIHPDHRDACRKGFEKILEDGREFSCQTVFLSKTGKEVVAEGRINCRFVNGKPLALRGTFRNITEKLKMEEELRRAQKMESVGILAGGIAHDFNNLLTAILGNILLAQLQSPSPELTTLLKNTEKAAHRAQQLTRQLLTFSKGGAPVLETASVVSIIKEVVPFILSGSNSDWKLEAGEDVRHVLVDSGQFSQVLENIIINSDQAMPDGGTITVSVRNSRPDEQLPELLRENRYVIIEIRDQGTGIPREYLTRIFDPYFTTKRKGSGLGLATAYSIIRNHGGLLMAESEPGCGTTMRIYLPATTETAGEKDAKPAGIPTGSGRVLIMDDDEMVLQVGSQMLTSLGYEVTTTRNGEEAVKTYEEALQSGTPFDVVILDLTVPGGMGGRETISRLREMDPRVQAIVSSGYSNDPVMAEHNKYGFADVVPKPYPLEQLAEAVHRLATSGRD